MSNKTVVKMLFGSYLYGLDTPDSDKDYKGIFIPELDDLIVEKSPKSISTSTGDNNSKNGVDDIDEEMYSLRYFIELAIKGDTAAIDMLHSANTIESSKEWEFLVENRHRFHTKSMKSYIDYVKKQAAKYGVKGSKIKVLEDAIDAIQNNDEFHNLEDIKDKLPLGEHSSFITSNTAAGKQEFYEICARKFQLTNKLDYTLSALFKILDSYGERAKQARDNDGIDWKGISHALRAGYQAKYIYLNGTFSYPLPESDFLLDVKQGKLNFLTEVQPVLDDLVDEVYKLSDQSDLPEKVQRKFWDEWLLKTLKEKLL